MPASSSLSSSSTASSTTSYIIPPLMNLATLEPTPSPSSSLSSTPASTTTLPKHPTPPQYLRPIPQPPPSSSPLISSSPLSPISPLSRTRRTYERTLLNHQQQHNTIFESPSPASMPFASPLLPPAILLDAQVNFEAHQSVAQRRKLSAPSSHGSAAPSPLLASLMTSSTPPRRATLPSLAQTMNMMHSSQQQHKDASVVSEYDSERPHTSSSSPGGHPSSTARPISATLPRTQSMTFHGHRGSSSSSHSNVRARHRAADTIDAMYTATTASSEGTQHRTSAPISRTSSAQAFHLTRRGSGSGHASPSSSTTTSRAHTAEVDPLSSHYQYQAQQPQPHQHQHQHMTTLDRIARMTTSASGPAAQYLQQQQQMQQQQAQQQQPQQYQPQYPNPPSYVSSATSSAASSLSPSLYQRRLAFASSDSFSFRHTGTRSTSGSSGTSGWSSPSSHSISQYHGGSGLHSFTPSHSSSILSSGIGTHATSSGYTSTYESRHSTMMYPGDKDRESSDFDGVPDVMLSPPPPPPPPAGSPSGGLSMMTAIASAHVMSQRTPVLSHARNKSISLDALQLMVSPVVTQPQPQQPTMHSPVLATRRVSTPTPEGSVPHSNRSSNTHPLVHSPAPVPVAPTPLVHVHTSHHSSTHTTTDSRHDPHQFSTLLTVDDKYLTRVRSKSGSSKRSVMGRDVLASVRDIFAASSGGARNEIPSASSSSLSSHDSDDATPGYSPPVGLVASSSHSRLGGVQSPRGRTGSSS